MLPQQRDHMTNLTNQLTATCSRIRMSFRKQTPSDFLKQIIGKPVVVKLNSGVDYRGEYSADDGNEALLQCSW